MPCSFLLWVACVLGSTSGPLILWSPCFLFLGWVSFSSDSVESPVSSATGSSLWAESVPCGFSPLSSCSLGPSHAYGCLGVGLLLFLSFSSSRLGPLFGWSSLLGFSAPPLPWLSCLELCPGAFLSFCHLRWRGVTFMLLLSSWPPLPSTGASLVFYPWFRLLTFLLSLRSLPFSISLSLASVSFALVFFSGTSLLHSCPCPCFSVLLCGLLGHCSWSSFGFCRQCFLVPLLRNLVESQYPSRRGPPFGPSYLIGLFLVVRVLPAFGLGCSSYSSSGRWFPSSPSAPG